MVAAFHFEPHELQILMEATRLLNEAHICEQLATDEGRLVPTRAGCRPHPLLKHVRDSKLAFAVLIEILRLHRLKDDAPALALMKNRRMVGVRKA